MGKTLAEEEITLERLFKAADMRAERDADGDLVIRGDGIISLVMVNPELKMIVLFSIWKLQSGFSDADTLAWINKLNEELMLVRFVMRPPGTLRCVYELLYDGGINPLQIVTTCKRFVEVCRDVTRLDTANMIDHD